MFGLVRLPPDTGETDPVPEPVDINKLALHLRLNTDDELELLASWITAARQFVEEQTQLSLVPSTWRLSLDRWPCSGFLVLPRGPISGSVGIGYVDADGGNQTLDPSVYQVDPATSRICLDSPPAVSTVARPAITIDYDAGGQEIPAPLRQAISIIAADFYSHREASGEVELYEIPCGAKCLLSSYASKRAGSSWGLE